MTDVLDRYNEYMQLVKSETIPQYEPYIDSRERELIGDVLDRNWFSEGKYTRIFEKNLAKFCGADYPLALANGTGALILGLKALGVGRGDEVIVPSFTHPADVNCIEAVGGIPKFCDIDPRSYTLSPKSLESNINEKTRAVIVVHLYGFAADMDRILEIAIQNNLFLVEDCAQALGTLYKGKHVGTFGDFGILSFFADKTITTGEGGMLLTNNQDLLDEVNIYKHDGRRERGIDVIERLGYNFRITELQTAIGVAQFERLSTIIEKKIENNERFKELLSECDQIHFPLSDANTYRVPHRVLIEVKDPESLKTYLAIKGIGCRRFYIPMHRQPCCNKRGEFPNSENAYSRGLCLPSYPMLTTNQIEYICANIVDYYKS